MTSVVAIGVMLLAATTWAQTDSDRRASDEPGWEIVTTDHFALAVPGKWKKLDRFTQAVVVFRDGNGIDAPEKDETGEPVTLTISVQRSRAAQPIEKRGADMVKALFNDPKIDFLALPTMQVVTLSDGAAAALLELYFLREDVKFYQHRLVTNDPDGNAFVATAVIAAGKDSRLPTPDTQLAKWLRAHLLTFVLDSRRMQTDDLLDAYLEWGKIK